MTIRFAWTFLVGLIAFAVDVQAGPTLDAIRARGHLTCGVSADVAGLSRRNARGFYEGFEADMCRAVAAAIFGSADKIQFQPIETVQSFLANADIDLVFHGLTWTFGRETEVGVRFGPVVFYDGQTFLVSKRLGARTIGQLLGRTVCVKGDSDFYANLQRTYRDRKMTLKATQLSTLAAAEEAFFAGRCDAFTADATELATVLLGLTPDPENYTILPERISKEPLAPLMRRDDEDFFDVVRWAIFALIEAEELGITTMNVDQMTGSEDRRVRSFLSASSDRVGLAPGWAGAVVRSVGNYGEVFERTLGQGSAARLERGINDLWSRGGLLYAPPIQ
jgi:general L-amino acid transport system substrate-binding protein